MSMNDMRRNLIRGVYLFPFFILLIVPGCREKSISADISGKYILESCTDSETGKKSVSNKVTTVIELKKITAGEYQVQYIGGDASGTKLNSRIDGRDLRGDLGDVTVRYSFNERLDTISYSSYGLDCVYIKLKK
jgi:hypothetical protein